MKIFIITDSLNLEKSNLKNTEIVVTAKENHIEFDNVEFYPKNSIRIEYTPQNKMVHIYFQLKNGEVLAIGEDD